LLALLGAHPILHVSRIRVNTFSLYLEILRLKCHNYTVSEDVEKVPITQLTSLPVQQAKKE
jgi:Na+-translocating ferredoxin:NAD+ oxidoreductase RnfE subunit